MSETTSRPKFDFDPNVLRDRYRMERDKRLREDGNAQYQEMKGDFKHYIDDPYSNTAAPRAAKRDNVDVVVVGGGFGGLLAAVRLREAGVARVRIIEKAGDFGGTWYWNRYPGAACDIESYVYLPLLEEMGYVPPMKYATGKEILWYSQEIGRRFGLYEDALFQTEVSALHWEADKGVWRVETNRGDVMHARFIAQSNGPLNRPKLPGIPGIQSFKGHTFHTSRWDYGYTGGDADGNLTGLRDKRVAIIGTGATAVQCVPHVGASAKELWVFQRTPSSIDERNDRPTNQDWFNSQEPGWHQRRMDNFNILTSGGVAQEDLVKDGWTEIIRNLLFLIQTERSANLGPAEIAEKMELADFEKMQGIRARVDRIVADPSVAESLKPWYRQFCKRPCFHDDYLPTFNRPNVHLIDTEGRGVERMTPDGVIANGKEYPVDCIIFSTGFEVGTSYSRRCGYETYGVDGQPLTDKWKNGLRTLHGMHVHGFPNLFIMGNAQSAATTNFPHAMDEAARHMTYILDRCRAEGILAVEASAEAEADWVQEIISVSRFNEDFQASCTPGYYNNEGQPSRRSIQNGSYGKGPNPYFRRIREWREDGTMAGLDRRMAP